jgi:hypothetical protein
MWKAENQERTRCITDVGENERVELLWIPLDYKITGHFPDFLIFTLIQVRIRNCDSGRALPA